MPSTYSNNLRIQLIAAGEQGNTWGITSNTNLGTLIEDAISGLVNLESPNAVWVTNVCTLSVRDGSYDAARNMYLVVPISVTLTNTGQIIAPEVPKVYVISNYSNGGYDVEIKTAASTVTCSVPNGTTKFVVCDGADFYDAVSATGQLILQDAITDPSQATTKYYVDSGLDAKINLSGNASEPMGGPLILTSAAPSEPYQAVPLTYVDSNCLFSTDTDEQSMLGPLILSESPGVGSGEFQAATKGYVDDNTWTIPVGAAEYTNSNVTVDANGHITNIENGAGGGGGGVVDSVTISPNNGFTQFSNTGSANITIALAVNGAAAADKVLFGTSSGVMRAATAQEIVSGIGSTAVANATNSTQLNGQNAAYYVAVNETYNNPNFISNLSVSKLNATATAGYVLTTNGTAAGAYWAANGGGGGGGVASVNSTNLFNGLLITVSPTTGSVGLTITSNVSGIVKGSGSGLASANGNDITTAIGSTDVTNATNASNVPWSGVSSKPADYPGGCTGNAATASNATNATNAAAVPWSGVSAKPADYPGGCTGAAGSVVNGVYTVGNQTIGGTKSFSDVVLLSSAGFMFNPPGEGGADTGIYWASDGVMNVKCNNSVIGQFTNAGYTGSITGTAAGLVGYSSTTLIRFGWDAANSKALIAIDNNTGFGANWPINADASYSVHAPNYATTGIGAGFGTYNNFVCNASVSLGSSSNKWVDVWAQNGAIQTSDANEKNTIQNSDLGLNFIQSLTPRSFKFNYGSNSFTEDDELIHNPGVRTHYGLIAQEVETALNGKDFAGLIIDADTGGYGLRYDEFISPLIKAVQELSAKVDSLTSELNALKGN